MEITRLQKQLAYVFLMMVIVSTIVIGTVYVIQPSDLYQTNDTEQINKSIIARSAHEGYNYTLYQLEQNNTVAAEQLLETSSSHVWALYQLGEEDYRRYYITTLMNCRQKPIQTNTCKQTINLTMQKLSQDMHKVNKTS